MKKMIRSWNLAGKIYDIFEKEGQSYLFYTDPQGSLKGLLKGHNFASRIEELSKDPNRCIECSVCDLIDAGISVDNGDIIEFGLSVQQANDILEEQIFEVKKINEND